MQKNLHLALATCIAVALSSCSKIEWIKDKIDDHKPPVSSKNELVAVTAEKGIFNIDAEPIPLLFKKTYAPNGKDLAQVITTFRSIATGALSPGYDTFAVSKKTNKTYFTTSEGDTLVTLETDLSGRPQKAWASPILQKELMFEFNFMYNGGKITEIRWNNGAVTNPYIKIEYETAKKNVSKVHFGGYGSSYTSKVAYSYDYTKTGKAQYYNEDMRGDFFTFWSFLNYLNVFEEIQPENLLVYSYYAHNDYPGDVVRSYKWHAFDANGKLTSYFMNERFATGSTPLSSGFWYNQWK